MDNNQHWDKARISKELAKIWIKTTKELEPISNEQYHFKKSLNTWSIAEEMEHLTISANKVASIMLYPTIFFNKFGKPNRPLRSYEEIEKRYFEKSKAIDSSLKAPSQFSPKKVNNYTKDQLIESYKKAGKKIDKRLLLWSEKRLNNVLVPHPLMGRMIFREIILFIIFHNEYHLKSILKKRDELE